MEYIGRRDKQVQLRGYRIELSEIEAAVQAQEAVSACAVGCSIFPGGEQRIICYFTGQIEAAALRQALLNALPPYMVPAHFCAIPKIPLTVNGKTDHAALEKSFFALQGAKTGSDTAQNGDIGAQVQAIWEEVLGHAVVSRRVGFLEAGGDSLMVNELAIRLNGLLPAEQDTHIRVVDLLDRPNIDDQARLLRRLMGQEDTPEQPKLRSRAAQRRARMGHDHIAAE